MLLAWGMRLGCIIATFINYTIMDCDEEQCTPGDLRTDWDFNYSFRNSATFNHLHGILSATDWNFNAMTDSFSGYGLKFQLFHQGYWNFNGILSKLIEISFNTQ